MLPAAEHTAKTWRAERAGHAARKGRGLGEEGANQNVMCVLSVVWERVRSGAERQQMVGLVPLGGSC